MGISDFFLGGGIFPLWMPRINWEPVCASKNSLPSIFWYKSLILDDVKLAALSDNSFECDIFAGSKHTQTLLHIFRGVTTSNPKIYSSPWAQTLTNSGDPSVLRLQCLLNKELLACLLDWLIGGINTALHSLCLLQEIWTLRPSSREIFKTHRWCGNVRLITPS